MGHTSIYLALIFNFIDFELYAKLLQRNCTSCKSLGKYYIQKWVFILLERTKKRFVYCT